MHRKYWEDKTDRLIVRFKSTASTLERMKICIFQAITTRFSYFESASLQIRQKV